MRYSHAIPAENICSLSVFQLLYWKWALLEVRKNNENSTRRRQLFKTREIGSQIKALKRSLEI